MDKRSTSEQDSLDVVKSQLFTARDEVILKRKLDLHIVVPACLMYLLCSLDRTNIGNARLLRHDTKDSLVDSLSLTETQYSAALMAFFVTYMIFETPSNIMLKKFRPSRWIAFLMLSWGTCSIALGAVQNYAALVAVRLFLGASEAGLFPGVVYFFTFWYKPEERSLRIALVLASSAIGGAFGGAIAFAVGHMNGVHGLEAWRWLFILEGTPTIAGAFLVWFFFPDWPETAMWLTEDEKALAIHRMENTGSKSQSKVTWPEARQTLLDLRLYAHYTACLCAAVPFASLSLFSPSIVAGLGYEGLSAQLFTVPPYVCAYVVTLLTAFSSDHFNARSLHACTGMVIAAIAFLIQALLPGHSYVPRYALLCVATSGSFACLPPLLGWLSSNIHSTGGAGLAIALSISFSGAGQMTGVWIYKAAEAPRYHTGHLTNFSMLIFGSIIVLGLRIMYFHRNAKLSDGARKWVL